MGYYEFIECVEGQEVGNKGIWVLETQIQLILCICSNTFYKMVANTELVNTEQCTGPRVKYTFRC